MEANHSNSSQEMGKFFGGLPKYVLLPILVDWLAMNDVGGLDSALCNKAQREVFMDWLSGRNSVTLSGTIHEKYNGVGYWNWLSVRSIHVHHISLFFEYFERDFCGKVIKKSFWEELFNFTCGSQHVRTLSRVVTKEMALPDKVNSIKISGLSDQDIHRFTPLNPKWLLCLTLVDFEDVSKPYNLDIVAKFVCKHCKSLQELTIHGCSDIPTRTLKTILSSATELVRLSLLERLFPKKSCYTEDDFSEWSVNCTKLKYLSLYQVTWGCDYLVHIITSRCTELQHLSLLMMDFNPDCIQNVARKCRKLVSIALETYPERICPLVTFEALAENCSALEYFNFQSFGSVSNTIAVKGVQMLLTHCPRLRCVYANVLPDQLECEVPKDVVIAPTRRLSGWYDAYTKSF